MYRVVVLLSLAVAALPSVARAQVANTQRPNVVLIITDDVGYGDFGSYGAQDIKRQNTVVISANVTIVMSEHSDVARRLAPLLASWQQDVDGEAKLAAPR